jgi:SAM-dependent methyltransferase
MQRSWMLDELAHAGAEHLDPDFVAAFDRKQAFDPSADVEALRAHGLGAHSLLIDLGAGTGKLALAAAPEIGHVIAVDVSPAMVQQLKARVAHAGVTNLDGVQGGFLTYEHDGPRADAVYTRNALHQIPDFWKAIALERIAGILAPGGVMLVRDLIYDFEPSDADAAFAKWLDGAVADPAVGYTRDDFEDHIRTEHSTYRWLFEPLLAAAGFEIVDVEYRGSIYASYSCVKRSS